MEGWLRTEWNEGMEVMGEQARGEGLRPGAQPAPTPQTAIEPC